MKSLLLALLFVSNAHAATLKGVWSQENVNVDNEPIVITKFYLYWGEQGQPISNKISVARGTPDASIGAMDTFRETLSNPLWVFGKTYCFQLTSVALNGTVETESAKTGESCAAPVFKNPKSPASLTISFQ